MNSIRCPSCSSQLKLPDDVIGQEVRCPRCEHVFVAELLPDLDLTPFGGRNGVNGPSRRPRRSVPLRAWKVGDRVLAPWEEEWLYPGVVLCIDDEVVFIRFDDGDRALRTLAELEPIELRPGEVVYCRRDRGELSYTPALVLGVQGEEIEVEYGDGETDRMTVSYIRVLRADLE